MGIAARFNLLSLPKSFNSRNMRDHNVFLAPEWGLKHRARGGAQLLCATPGEIQIASRALKWAIDDFSFPQVSLMKFNAIPERNGICCSSGVYRPISWALNLIITSPGASRESRSAPSFMLLPHFGGTEQAQDLKKIGQCQGFNLLALISKPRSGAKSL
jgi:hypothetical protein